MSQLLSSIKKKKTEADMNKKRKGLSRATQDDLQFLLLCIPALVFIIIWHYIPMGGAIVAFKNFNPRKGVMASEWVGLDNFMFFFKSQDAVRTIRNTLLYSVDFLGVEVLVGVTIALLLYHMNAKIPLKVYHTTILMPRFISINIVAFMAYAILSPGYGVLNQAIQAFGGEPIMWYSEPKYWPLILTIVHVWQIAGSGSLYYYSSLMAIDKSLFEAAAIDGAGTLKQCWHVAIPHLIPIMTMMTILGLGGIFNGSLGLSRQVTMGQGSLFETVDIIPYYTYRALLGGQLVKSAAVGLFQNVVGLILVVTVNKIVQKISPENSMF